MPAAKAALSHPTVISGACRDTQVPREFANHPQVEGQFFYTLPEKLLDLLIRKPDLNRGIQAERFDSDLLHLEQTLGRISGDHSVLVGFHRNMPIEFNLLHRPPLKLPPQPVAFADDNGNPCGSVQAGDPAMEKILQQLKEADDLLFRQRQGYLGWLLGNSEFITDRDEFVRRHRQQIRENGIPQATFAHLDHQHVTKTTHKTDARNWEVQFRTLCRKWRLETFAGPRLPIPRHPDVPAMTPGALAENLLDDGIATVRIPDVCPMPGRGLLADQIDGVLAPQSSQPDHLAEWLRIVSRSNSSRNTIATYARRFQVQHYVRVLYSRHADALHRGGEKVREALAAFLDLDEEVIRKDMRWLKSQLGVDWLESQQLA